MEVLWFFTYTIILLANKDTLTSFSVYVILIAFICHIALAKTSNTILNRLGKNEHPCLVSDFYECFECLSSSVYIGCGLAAYCPYYAEICFLYP